MAELRALSIAYSYSVERIVRNRIFGVLSAKRYSYPL